MSSKRERKCAMGKIYPSISEEFIGPREWPFRPFVYVCSEFTKPSNYFYAGSTKRIKIESEATLCDVQHAIRDYLKNYEGQCPRFGRATGFIWVRSESEGTFFGANGDLVGENSGRFWPIGYLGDYNADRKTSGNTNAK
jgi:hypothetical protein